METKRSDAIQSGDMYYNTKLKCKNGHFSKRATADGSCVECRAVYQRKQRADIRKKAVNNVR